MANADFRKDVTMPLRPRSVYTSHSYNQEESNLSAFQDYTKFLEGGLGQAELVGAPAWQPPWRAPMQRKPTFYPGDDLYHADTWRDLEISEGVGGARYVGEVTHHGILRLRLRDHVKVDMTIDGAVRVTNLNNNIVMALSRTGAYAALIHPNGRVYHYGSRVEIQARHQQGNNKYAKMWYKGVSFTAEQCALVYLVDAAGTRTTTDTFLDMSQDYTFTVFYNDSRHGQSYVNDALSLLQAAQYWQTDDGIDNWIINNVRISQTADGLVRGITDALRAFFVAALYTHGSPRILPCYNVQREGGEMGFRNSHSSDETQQQLVLLLHADIQRAHVSTAAATSIRCAPVPATVLLQLQVHSCIAQPLWVKLNTSLFDAEKEECISTVTLSSYATPVTLPALTTRTS